MKNKKATITDDPTLNPMADSDFSRQHSELPPGQRVKFKVSLSKKGAGARGPTFVSELALADMNSIETTPTDPASQTVSGSWTLGVVLAVALGFIMAMLDVIPNWGLSVSVVFTVFALCMMTAVVLVQRGINPDL